MAHIDTDGEIIETRDLSGDWRQAKKEPKPAPEPSETSDDPFERVQAIARRHQRERAIDRRDLRGIQQVDHDITSTGKLLFDLLTSPMSEAEMDFYDTAHDD